MAARAAAGAGVDGRRVAVASTGVIGFGLPMPAVRRGIDAASQALRPEGWDDFSRAILTTDKGPKLATARAGRAIVHGCAKGAGMIAPNMATTLAFVATDAKIAAPSLRRLLKRTADRTVNCAIVDGDTSTNDSLFLLASGRVAVAEKALAAALDEVLGSLATQLVRDGEGATHVVRIEVEGARSQTAATRVARTIATSPLVKTAIAGADPNWGRILCAAGNAGVPLARATSASGSARSRSSRAASASRAQMNGRTRSCRRPPTPSVSTSAPDRRRRTFSRAISPTNTSRSTRAIEADDDRRRRDYGSRKPPRQHPAFRIDAAR